MCLLGFITSLQEGKEPADWRHAIVTPVYTKGRKVNTENYRPISLTWSCCKIMEHVITSNIMSYLDKKTCNLLFFNQHGFRSKLSCETQLLQFIQDFANILNDGGQSDVIVMDFSKSFNKVDHQRLLLKFHHIGLNGQIIKWISAFLSNRTRYSYLTHL